MQGVATPTLYVAVSALPKGALVEKQVLLHTGRFEVQDEDGELEIVTQLPTFREGEPNSHGIWKLYGQFTSRKSRRIKLHGPMGVFTLRQRSCILFNHQC